MSSIKVEEIDKIELSHKDWWQPKIDKKVYKQLCQRSDAKAWFHTILYFGVLFITGLIAIYSWGTWYAIPAFIYMVLSMPVVMLGGMNMVTALFLNLEN